MALHICVEMFKLSFFQNGLDPFPEFKKKEQFFKLFLQHLPFKQK